VRVLLVVLVAAAGLVGCGNRATSTDGTTSAADPPVTAPPAPRAPALCGVGTAHRAGRIDDRSVDELSGLALARRDPQLLLAIEDSGNAAGITLLRRDGHVVSFLVIAGAENVDWEDVGTGPGPDGAPLVFVGDIGDNAARRDTVQVYRLPEPAADAHSAGPAARLDLRYPDGAHDAEALLVDPLRRELIVVTKSLLGGTAYSARTDAPAGASRTLRRGPRVALGTITGGSVSGDGRIVVLRSYGVLALWRRHGSEPLARTLARSPTCRGQAALDTEGQGEAIALTRDGRRAYTAPEGAAPLLRRYG